MVGELVHVCAQIVFTYLYLARIGRPDLLWSLNILARTATKWNGARDQRLARMISYFISRKTYRQFCRVGDKVDNCKLGLFQDTSFGSATCTIASQRQGVSCTCVQILWMCKKPTAVFSQQHGGRGGSQDCEWVV